MLDRYYTNINVRCQVNFWFAHRRRVQRLVQPEGRSVGIDYRLLFNDYLTKTEMGILNSNIKSHGLGLTD